MNRSRIAIWFSLSFSILVFPLLAQGAPLTLAWDPSADSIIAGYKVYYGTSTGSYQAVIDVGNSTTCTISDIQDGKTYYFAVTSYDATGIESGYSNEISYNPNAACGYRISPASQSVSSSGGARTVSVSTTPGCAWTAVSNVSWVVITSNNSSEGSGTVSYSVAVNSSASSRTGKLTVAGQTLTIKQKRGIYYSTEPKNSGN